MDQVQMERKGGRKKDESYEERMMRLVEEYGDFR